MADAMRTTTDKPQMQSQPKPPFPEQHQRQPGLESKLDPRPRWKGDRYRPADKLQGKKALITGGDSGIGRSVAYHFAREGADVAITYLPPEKSDAEETCQAIKELGRQCLMLEGDLTSAEFCREVIERTVRELGGLDILVSNAAWQNRKSSVTELSDEELDRTMKTNVYAYLRLARQAVPHMQPGAVIIATGSVVGLEGSAQLPDYAATKGAIQSITKTLARELLEKGIRVNCVAPGPVWTPLNPSDQGLTAEQVATFGQKQSPLKRPAQPEELAPSYVFLASDADSSYITGTILPVTGKPE
jgi:NAD(P)-dependent dehydrogenase (short-subunit alcohol dehydrogenase family)